MHRKSMMLSICLLLIFTAWGMAQNPEPYHLVRLIAPTVEQIVQLKMAGIPLEESTISKERYIDIVLWESELQIVKSLGVSHRILQENLAAYYEVRNHQESQQPLPPPERTDPVHMKYGSMGGFYTYQEIVTDLDSMNILYPNICAPKDSIGRGWDGNVLWMVKISDNPGINEDEPEVMYDALHHAREASAYMTLLYSMWWLLENYGTDPEATYLINNRELYFIPVANPDGLVYNQLTNPGGGGNWRKNRRNNGGSYGVDLNRNYGYQWGYDNIGSSPTPSSETYRGPSAFSEPETQALRDFFLAHDFKTAMTIHTYGNQYLYAYGYANVPPESVAVHQEYGAEISRDNGYAYGQAYQIEYAANGRTQDWQLHTNLTINFEPEIGGNGFWPPRSQIFPEARANQHVILWQAWCGGAKIKRQSVTIVGGILEPGHNESMYIDLKNVGMGNTLTDVTATITPNSPYISPIDPTSNFGAFNAREIRNNSTDPFRFAVMPGAPQGAIVGIPLQVQYEGFSEVDTIFVQIGTPIIAFQDSAENGTGNWTMGSWGVTNTYYHSPTRSFTDSPSGNYGPNQTNRMTMQGSVNLAGFINPTLKFWTRWEIEAGYDFGQVKVSSDGGTTWIPIAGNYTVSGNGQGVQPSGEPGYDGFQTTWVQENMSLAAFTGINNFKLRFELRSDAGVEYDGWYVDDIQVVGFQQGPLPPITDLIILRSIDGVELQWTPVPGISVYHVYRNTEPISNNNLPVTDSTVSGPPYRDYHPLSMDRCFYAVTYECSP
jgi:carboxypeptidase T